MKDSLQSDVNSEIELELPLVYWMRLTNDHILHFRQIQKQCFETS